jgi:DNA-binding transcriptional LysR family regulator
LDFLKNWGRPFMQTNLRVFDDSGLVGWQMAHQGLGISAMTYGIAHHFPKMKLVLPELVPIPALSWLATHKELHSAKRIRLVYDRITETFSANKSPVRVD